MKVLRVIARLNVGGPAKHVSWLSSGLDQKGWENTLVYGEVEENESDMEFFAREMGVRMVKLKSMARSISIKDDLRCLFEIYKLIQKIKPNIVHTHTSKAGFLGRIAAITYNITHQRKIKIIHTFHGHTFQGYFSRPKERLFLLIERILGRFSDKIITISEQQYKEILETYKVGHPANHQIVKLGIDTSFANSLQRNSFRKDFKIAEDQKIFGIVGRIAPIKNHTLFLQSIADFNRIHTSKKTVFVIIGDGEPDLVAGLKKQTHDLGIDNLIFAGNQSNPSYFYGGIDFLVLTSLNEGTPVSILEAFACGIPVVSTNVGGVPDLIINNERGILIPSGDLKGLVNAYESLLVNDNTQIINQAKTYVVQNYSVTALVDSIDKMYRVLLND